MIFVWETWPKVIKENPNMQVLDVMKEVGWRWKSITDSDWMYFERKSGIDKERYDSENKEYHWKLEDV
jgi:hypothetical protein